MAKCITSLRCQIKLCQKLGVDLTSSAILVNRCRNASTSAINQQSHCRLNRLLILCCYDSASTEDPTSSYTSSRTPSAVSRTSDAWQPATTDSAETSSTPSAPWLLSCGECYKSEP